MTERLARLGSSLRQARVRRGLTMEAAAEKVGAGVRSVREAERGNPGTSIGVSVALLTLYGLATELDRLADPSRDLEGQWLGGHEARQRAGRKRKKAARTAPPPAATPAPSAARPDETPLPLSAAVLRGLSPDERAALQLLHRHGSARTRELTQALGLRPQRVEGLLRELRRKLHGLGVRDYLTDEPLPDGEALFRVKAARPS